MSTQSGYGEQRTDSFLIEKVRGKKEAHCVR